MIASDLPCHPLQADVGPAVILPPLIRDLKKTPRVVLQQQLLREHEVGNRHRDIRSGAIRQPGLHAQYVEYASRQDLKTTPARRLDGKAAVTQIFLTLHRVENPNQQLCGTRFRGRMRSWGIHKQYPYLHGVLLIEEQAPDAAAQMR